MEHTPQKELSLELDVDALLAEPFTKWDPTQQDLTFTPFKAGNPSPNCSTATPASTWAPTPHDSVWTPSASRWSPTAHSEPAPAALASLGPAEKLHVCTQLQQCAEQYAVAKKCHAGADLDAALRAIYQTLRASLGEEEVEEECADQALRDLVAKYVPEFGGEVTSIGSLPTVLGRERDARPCRFFPKGKCFDGVLCRFSHAPETRCALHNITNELSKMSPSSKNGSSPTRRGSRGAGSARRKKEGRSDTDKQLWALLGGAQPNYGAFSAGQGDRKRLDTRPDKLATLFDALKASGGVAPMARSGYAPPAAASPQVAQEWWQAYAAAYNDAATAHAQALIAGLNVAPSGPSP